MLKRRNRLGWKITFWLLSGVVLTSTLISVLDYRRQQRVFLDTINAHLLGEARLMAALVQTARSSDDFAHLLAGLTVSRNDPFAQDHLILLVDRNGTIQLAHDPEMVGQRWWNEAVDAVLDGETQQAFGVMDIAGQESYFGVFGVLDPTGQPMAIVMGKPYAVVRQQLNFFLVQRLSLMVLLTITVMLTALAATHYTVLAPLRKLVRTMEQVSRGDFEAKVDIAQEDELGVVGRTFNRMLEVLRQTRKRSEEERQRLALLYDINRRLSAVTDWEALVDLVLHLPERIVPLKGALFLSYHAHPQRFILEGAWGFPPSALAALEQHLVRIESPPCLQCPSCIAHTDSQCTLLGPPGLLQREGDTILCLRLAHGRTTVGFLYLYLADPASLTPEHMQLLNAVSGELAVAIAAALARSRELRLLVELRDASRSPTHLTDSLDSLLERLMEATQARQAAIFLYDEDSQYLYPAAWRHLNLEELDSWRGLALQGLHQEDPVVVTRRFLAEPQTQQIVVVPLRMAQQPLGVLVLATERTQPYTPHGLMFLSALATQTAMLVQMSRLYTRLEQQAILEERTRLAREIHDVLAQNLAFIRWKIYQLQKWWEQGTTERVPEELALLRQVVEETYREVRETIADLRLVLDEEFTFEAVLREYAQRFQERTGVRVHLHMEPMALTPYTQVQLLRVIQEALTNVRKHAQASQVHIRLWRENDVLHLVIQDDGVGFRPEEYPHSKRFGLRIMEERVHSLGGYMTIHSRPGEGTTLEIVLPAMYTLLRQEVESVQDSGSGGG